MGEQTLLVGDGELVQKRVWDNITCELPNVVDWW
jgi:hypothetical protein